MSVGGIRGPGFGNVEGPGGEVEERAGAAPAAAAPARARGGEPVPRSWKRYAQTVARH
jgi:hypothetical protein